MYHPHLNPPPSRGRRLQGCADLLAKGGGDLRKNTNLLSQRGGDLWKKGTGNFFITKSSQSPFSQ